MASDKVAFFLPSLGGGGGGPGGAERITLNLAGELVSRGYGAELVLADLSRAYHSLIPAGVHVIDLGSARVSRCLRSLSSYLKREKPQALLSSLDHGNVVAIWAGRLARVRTRIVVANHIQLSVATQEASNLRGRLVPWFVRHSYKRADAIVSVSHGAAADLSRIAGIPIERINVIYNPVLSSRVFEMAIESPDHPWLANGEPPLIIAAGRLTRQKNFGLLLEAFSIVRRQQIAKLIIFGEGEERHQLEQRVKDLQLAADVSLPGWSTNVYAFMARANLFVLSSLWEALPTVLIEALALGLPVVSTDCRSGPREILRDGEYGTLVPVGDAELLARGMGEELARPRRTVPKEFLRPFEVSFATEQYLNVLGLQQHA